jgi:type IV fimbrial biogenesis protein FimT
MRHVKPMLRLDLRTCRAPRQRGLTLIELMVAIAVAAVLLASAAPYFGDYIVNSRLRESGNLLLSEALAAQSEAAKRNNRVRLAVSAGTLQVLDLGTATPTLLRTRSLSGNVVVSTAADVDFTGDGRLATWPTAATIKLVASGVTCSDELRCPQLVIDAGGAIRLCGNQLQCS